MKWYYRYSFFYLCHKLDDGKTVDISCAGAYDEITGVEEPTH